MAEVAPEIIEKVRLFAAALSQNVRLERVFLFGSHARGTAEANSDIDILVISDDFKKMSPFQTGFLLFRTAAKIPGDLQPLGYTTEEYRNCRDNLFLSEILNGSVEIPLQ
jgi:predicted nucleotidyltransferase